MKGVDLDNWTENENQIAVRIPEERGFFGGNQEVPPGTFAFLPHPDVDNRILEPGQEVPDQKQAILVKYAEFPISLYFQKLSSEEGYLFSCNLTLILRVDSEEEYLEGFYKNLMTRSTYCSLDTVRQYLMFPVKSMLSKFVSNREASTLYEFENLSGIEERLKSELDEIFFSRGLEYRTLGNLEFHSDDYEEELERQRRERDQIMEHEEELKKQKRREEKLQKVLKMLKEGAGNQLLSEVNDSRVHSILYRELIEEGLLEKSPETAGKELSKRLDRDAREILYKAIRRVNNEPEESSGISEDYLLETRTESVYLISGKSLYEIRPGSSEAEEKIHFDRPLRSVSPGESERVEGKFLLLGARQGVYRVSMEDWEIDAYYRLPEKSNVRGGVNSADSVGNYILASHSEYGVCIWNFSHPDNPELICPDRISENRTTRALSGLSDHLFCFTSGSRLYMGIVHDTSRLETLQPALPAEGTDFYPGESNLIAAAGHRHAGGLVAWENIEPAKIEKTAAEKLKKASSVEGTVLMKNKKPVTSIDLALLSGVPHLLYTQRDTGVRARMIGTGLESTYESGNLEMDHVQASSTDVYGLDRSGRFLLRWEPGNSGEFVERIDCMTFTDHPVYDLEMYTTSEVS